MRPYVRAAGWIAVLVLLVAACAPAASVEPEEFTTRLSFEQAFAETINVISTQPYPADSSGWIITRSDQQGGFISAELTYRACRFLGLGCREETAHVSIALVRRQNDTAVNIGRSGHNVARDLSARISERLGL